MIEPAVAPPPSLVEDGLYRYGTYNAPIKEINPLDVAGTAPTALLRRGLRNLRLKEWEAFQLGNDDWFVLGAVYNTKSVGILQTIAVHKASGRILRWQSQVPAPRLHVARGLTGTRSHGRSLQSKNRSLSISIGNNVGKGAVSVDVSHSGDLRSGLPALELHGVGSCGPADAGHLVICHPFGGERALYSHKCMMPFSGTMRIGSETTVLGPDRSFMILDDHHGDYPSPMKYDWVTAARRSDDGVLEGFNLTANQVQDPERFNENAVWIGNRVHRLPAVRFERPAGVHGPWRIIDAASVARPAEPSVDVTFVPEVRSEFHMGPDKSLAEYYAPYGRFEGRIVFGDGTLEVDGFYGVGEQKLIRV